MPKKRTTKATRLALVAERKPPLPVPEDLTGKYAAQFIEICETVAAQSGLTVSDGPVIASVARSHRRAELFDGKAAEALGAGEAALAIRFANHAEKAAGSA